MSGIKEGSTVRIHGFECKVTKASGKCYDKDCDRPTVEIIDPEGLDDTVHEDECELVNS